MWDPNAAVRKVIVDQIQPGNSELENERIIYVLPGVWYGLKWVSGCVRL
jgi:hypothetical protein